jgi:hypothetical protein
MGVGLNGVQTMQERSKDRPGLARAYTNTIGSKEDVIRRFLTLSLSLSMALTPMLSVRAADYPVLAPDTKIPVAAPADSTQYLDPGKDASASLVVSQDVLDNRGGIVLPKGAEVRGRFAPVPGGLKFLADEVLINGQYTSLRASSDMIRDERDIREDSGRAVARDSATRVVGGALSGAFTGGVDWGGILGGTAAGVIMQNATAPRVVVVRPDRSINLRLDAPFSIRR